MILEFLFKKLGSTNIKRFSKFIINRLVEKYRTEKKGDRKIQQLNRINRGWTKKRKRSLEREIYEVGNIT